MFDGAEQRVIEEAISPYMVLGMLLIMPVQGSLLLRIAYLVCCRGKLHPHLGTWQI